MKNKKTALLLIPLTIVALVYVFVNNIFIAIGIGLIYLIYFVFRLFPLIKKMGLKREKVRLLYSFVNDLIVSISVYKNVNKAGEEVFEPLKLEENKSIGDISNFDALEKIKYLASYFQMPIYDAFLNIINAYMEQGGNIIEMCEQISSYLLNIEGYFLKGEKLRQNKLIEFISLWLFCLFLLLFVRIALLDFYSQLLASFLFVGGISILFLFALLSLEIFFSKISQNVIQGVDL